MQQRDDIMSVDAMMDERYGKVGTPEREAFRQRVGTNKSYISRIENGSVEPGAGMFLRILSALGLRFEVTQSLAIG